MILVAIITATLRWHLKWTLALDFTSLAIDFSFENSLQKFLFGQHTHTNTQRETHTRERIPSCCLLALIVVVVGGKARNPTRSVATIKEKRRRPQAKAY